MNRNDRASRRESVREAGWMRVRFFILYKRETGSEDVWHTNRAFEFRNWIGKLGLVTLQP